MTELSLAILLAACITFDKHHDGRRTIISVSLQMSVRFLFLSLSLHSLSLPFHPFFLPQVESFRQSLFRCCSLGLLPFLLFLFAPLQHSFLPSLSPRRPLNPSLPPSLTAFLHPILASFALSSFYSSPFFSRVQAGVGWQGMEGWLFQVLFLLFPFFFFFIFPLPSTCVAEREKPTREKKKAC